MEVAITAQSRKRLMLSRLGTHVELSFVFHLGFIDSPCMYPRPRISLLLLDYLLKILFLLGITLPLKLIITRLFSFSGFCCSFAFGTFLVGFVRNCWLNCAGIKIDWNWDFWLRDCDCRRWRFYCWECYIWEFCTSG